MGKKAIFNWSSGKDSALSLYKIMNDDSYEVQCLLTSISEQYQRISMHGVRVELLEQQAKSIGIPLVKIEMPEMPTMESYEKSMTEILTSLKEKGASYSIFGDIFLDDLRKYREDKLNELGLKAVFPLWKMDTSELIKEFLSLGFKTIVTCVNEKYLDKSFAGRVIDEKFLADLPSNVDPCGENGEFHTFAFDGPIFDKPIKFEIGEVAPKKYTAPKQDDDSDYQCKTDDKKPFDTGFWYCDLLPIK